MRGTALGQRVPDLQATLVDRIGPAPEVICSLIAEITHGLAAQAFGLGFGHVVQVGLGSSLKGIMGHGGLRWVVDALNFMAQTKAWKPSKTQIGFALIAIPS
jgi:hypothetical protein